MVLEWWQRYARWLSKLDREQYAAWCSLLALINGTLVVVVVYSALGH